MTGDPFIRCLPIGPHLELVGDLRDVGDEPAEENPVDLDSLAQLGLRDLLYRAQLSLPSPDGTLHHPVALRGPHQRLDGDRFPVSNCCNCALQGDDGGLLISLERDLLAIASRLIEDALDLLHDRLRRALALNTDGPERCLVVVVHHQRRLNVLLLLLRREERIVGTERDADLFPVMRLQKNTDHLLLTLTQKHPAKPSEKI